MCGLLDLDDVQIGSSSRLPWIVRASSAYYLTGTLQLCRVVTSGNEKVKTRSPRHRIRLPSRFIFDWSATAHASDSEMIVLPEIKNKVFKAELLALVLYLTTQQYICSKNFSRKLISHYLHFDPIPSGAHADDWKNPNGILKYCCRWIGKSTSSISCWT